MNVVFLYKCHRCPMQFDQPGSRPVKYADLSAAQTAFKNALAGKSKSVNLIETHRCMENYFGAGALVGFRILADKESEP